MTSLQAFNAGPYAWWGQGRRDFYPAGLLSCHPDFILTPVRYVPLRGAA